MADLRNTRLSIYLRNRLLNAHGLNDFNAGLIDIMDGAQPATPETAIGAQVRLVTLTLANPIIVADSASGGVATFSAVTDGVAVAGGTAAWFRIWNAARTQVMADGNVGASGDGNVNNIELPTTTITGGLTVGVTSASLTLPMQGL